MRLVILSLVLEGPVEIETGLVSQNFLGCCRSPSFACPLLTDALHSLDLCLQASAADLHVIGNQKLRIANSTVETETSRKDHTGVATMTSLENLSLIQTIVETTDKHDFVSPQVSVDSTHQQEQQEMELAQTYILQQAHPTIQTLAPLYNAKTPSYTIRLDTIGSFLKPQPHMLITQDPGGLHIAEVTFQVNGFDSTIIYKDGGISQKLVLQKPQDQRYECLINGKPHWWHHLGPSKSVFELTEETKKRVALFVYAEGMAQRTGSTSGNNMLSQEKKIGEVHIIGDFLREPIALRQILFSAVVVVEQTKRRATSMANQTSPLPSKNHFPGRHRSGQHGRGEG